MSSLVMSEATLIMPHYCDVLSMSWTRTTTDIQKWMGKTHEASILFLIPENFVSLTWTQFIL